MLVDHARLSIPEAPHIEVRPLPVLDAWQYRITQNPESGSIRLPGGFWLTLGPGLPAVALLDRRGRVLGHLVGHPIEIEAETLHRADVVLDQPGPVTPAGLADAVLRRFGGLYLWVQVAGGEVRVYPDSSCQVPCVWDTETGQVGATAHALLADPEYQARFDSDLFARLGIDGEGWFPGGLTAHRGIERLLPNHYLDLATLKAHRFWGTSAVPEATDPEEVTRRLVGLVRSQVQAIRGDGRAVALSLTAGRETRLLIGCARDLMPELEVATVVAPEWYEPDHVIARRIGREARLHQIRLPETRGTDEQRETFIRRGGHCYADGNARYHPSVWPIADSHHFVGGPGGEVGRAFFWHESDGPDTPLSGKILCGRLGLPNVPEVIERLDGWLEGLAHLDSRLVLDLAYLEQRMGPWYAAQFCCDPTLIRFAPLVCRNAVELLMSLPPEWKRDSRLAEETLRRVWPELLKHRFNSLGPVSDFLLKVHKVLVNPSRLAKKLRKLTG